jgi:hypothetical protein
MTPIALRPNPSIEGQLLACDLQPPLMSNLKRALMQVPTGSIKRRLSLLCAIALGPLLLSFSQVTHASGSCSLEVIEEVSRAWGIGADDTILDSTCKQWPSDNRSQLVVLTFARQSHLKYVDELPMHVALIQNHNIRILNHFQTKIVEDAAWNVQEGYFTLDTAKYYLAKDTRAFAVRERGFRESRGMDHGFDDQLTLFVVEPNTKIRPVLSIPHMRVWRYEFDGANIRSDAIVATLTASVAKTSSHGLADLLFVASEERNHRILFSEIVSYDGTTYRAEHLLEKLEAWWHQ